VALVYKTHQEEDMNEIKNYHAPISMLQDKHVDQPIFNGGYVRYVEHHGSDQLIAKAARTSFARDEYKDDAANEGLIDYLVRNHHGSPLELPGITVQIKVPMQLKNQLIRHRTARLNESSLRYIEHDGTFYVPDYDQCCHQSSTKKQGSGDEMTLEMATAVQQIIIDQCEAANATYARLLAPPYNMAKEQARGVLTLNHYVTMVWQMDIRNMLWLLRLRLDHHAQGPIRQFARLLANIVEDLFPMTYKAFDEHILNGMTLSKSDIQYLADNDCNIKTAHLRILEDINLMKTYNPNKPVPGVLLERAAKFERIVMLWQDGPADDAD
jgi:thymidylate synthase (FAD)